VTVGVLFGGSSPEHDVSVLTGLQAARVLESARRPVQRIYWSKENALFAVPSAVEAPDFLGPLSSESSTVATVDLVRTVASRLYVRWPI
jgi:D-alanine-D-alanine ligase